MTFFVISFSFFSFVDYSQAAGGIVQCGRGLIEDDPVTTDINETYEDRCKLCDLIVGINDIIKWGRNIVIVVALTAITAGGILYIISAGDEQMMQTAKNLIKQALWGVVIVMGAWVIVNTTMIVLATNSNLGIGVTKWSEFDCTGLSVDDDGDGTGYGADNCPSISNPDQADTDGDGLGDACDECNGTNSSGDTDGDKTCNDLDEDDDNDGIPDSSDKCPLELRKAGDIDPDGDGCVGGCVNVGAKCSGNNYCCSGSCDFTGVNPPQQGTCKDSASTFCHELTPAGICLPGGCGNDPASLIPYPGRESACDNPPNTSAETGYVGWDCCINPNNL